MSYHAKGHTRHKKLAKVNRGFILNISYQFVRLYMVADDIDSE